MFVTKLTRGWEMHCDNNSNPILLIPDPNGECRMMDVSPDNLFAKEWIMRIRDTLPLSELSKIQIAALKRALEAWGG